MFDETEENDGTDLIEEAQAAAEPAADESTSSESADTGSAFSRFQSAGLDLENMDPAELAQAHAFHSRYKGQQVFTEEELPQRVQGLLTRLAQTTEGQEYLRRYVGQQASQPAATTSTVDPDDPYAGRFQQLEQAIRQVGGTMQQQQAALQELAQAKQDIEREREAKVVADELGGYLQQAIEAVPGARGVQKFLEDDFWVRVSAGRFKAPQLQAPGIKAWVKAYVQERSPGGGVPRKPAPSAGKRGGGGKVNEQELEGLDYEDITKAAIARLGLQ